MSASSRDAGTDPQDLRKRLPQQPSTPQQADSSEAARDVVRSLNDAQEESGVDEKAKRTYGRTPDGTGRSLEASWRLSSWTTWLGQVPRREDSNTKQSTIRREVSQCVIHSAN